MLKVSVSKIGSIALLILTFAFFVVCFLKAFDDARQRIYICEAGCAGLLPPLGGQENFKFTLNCEVGCGGLLPPLGGQERLQYTFNAPSNSLARLYLFAASTESLRDLRGEKLLVTLISPATGEAIFSEAFEIGSCTTGKHALKLDFPSIQLNKGQAVLVKLSMPETEPGQGIQFWHGDTLLRLEDSLEFSGRRIAGQSLSLQFLPERLPAPFVTTIIALALFALCLVFVRPVTNLSWATFFSLGAITFTLSIYAWESRLWGFWGEYWPDAYVGMARAFRLWLDGTISWETLNAFLSNHRNGQCWLVPFLIAGISKLGLDYQGSFFILNVAFMCGGILLLVFWAQKLEVFRKNLGSPLLIAGLCCQLVIIRSAGSLLTDAGGMFFTVLFVVTYARFLDKDEFSPGYAGLAGLAIALGCQTRIALLPLVCVPWAMAGWRFCFLSENRLKRALTAGIPGIIGLMLLAVSWQTLDLWQTVAVAWEVAAQEEFRQHFSLKGFALSSMLGLQIALLALPFGARLFLKKESHALLVILMAGFGAMLYLGRIIPWSRYWTPVAPLAVFYACMVMSERINSRWIYMTVIIITALLNLYYVFNSPAFC